jgi:hypothetical protein
MPALLLSALLVLATAASPSSGPVLAREDTLHTEVPEVLVTAPRVTLDEILDRVARGEARRDSMLHDQVFTAALRIFHRPRGATETRLFEESVWRVYKRKPSSVRALRLRKTLGPSAPKDDDDDDDAEFTPSMSEEAANFAFRAEARRDYRYHIVGRDLVGDHVVYRIAFEPRSPADLSRPTGLVWVDTNDFVVVRQELTFPRSPIPLFVRSLDRMVIERVRVDGTWVMHRMLMRAQLTMPMPKIGSAIEFAFLFDDYAINRGVPDSVFVVRKK